MTKNRAKILPPSNNSLDDLVQFFDTHDMGEYWDQMREAHFDIDIKRRTHLVAVDDELISKLAEIAKSKHISTEKLVNSWLRDKIIGAG